MLLFLSPAVCDNGAVAASAPAASDIQNKAQPAMTPPVVTFEPMTFSDLAGWSEDDHLAAWKAFLASCKPVLRAGVRPAKHDSAGSPQALIDVCERAVAMSKAKSVRTRSEARQFFETNFRPHRISGGDAEGLLTGYYEPLIKGSRIPDKTYKVPIYRRPPDLVNVVAESERGAKSGSLTHQRKTAKGLEPYLTRADIEQGGLEGQGLELMYLKDPVDVFFMQVQGSGRIQLPSGEKVRVTYDGKNGHPYTSVGRVLIDEGQMTADEMSLKSLKKWLKTDKDRAKPVLWKNKSYVFFKELSGTEANAPMGVGCIPLQAGRSLAIDTTYYPIGTPIFVDAPKITHATKSGGFRRLMVAHDVGSAIKGTERGDIYFGSGDDAGRLAGVTKQPGHLYALLPIDGGAENSFFPDPKTASSGL
ncbi:MltA domain-containing protein [Hyphomicrobium sp.]|uniref:murein transglycosylase A n=1 Tax=Hyphomicrobium sp. TaxID=82 RepID=UPI0025C203F8|nr:MltA domain-containing protein [Hyphomicrobium sp.]